ncbi:hypothetical protein HAX54_039139 [Datura stramonium]|uniref:Uncharacterized protein n=1 Tax=Datura stramonium TaxID=4076 RepID=A0ABS8RNP1_DATST|nr:hypothetical protein [Datura stramonium]
MDQFSHNAVTAVGVVGFGIWMSAHHDGCRKSLTLPVLGLGGVIFVYLIMLCDFMAILVFTVLAFIVTHNGSGHSVNGLRYKTLKQYKLAKLTPIEAGCCRPPSETASLQNSKKVKCYNCDSCKAGVAQYMKTEWRVVAIFNVILFVVLSIIYCGMLCKTQCCSEAL